MFFLILLFVFVKIKTEKLNAQSGGRSNLDLKEKKPELLLVAAALLISFVVMMYSVFDSPKYNNLQAVEITTNREISLSQSKNVSVERININTAGVEELMKLELVGEKKAQAIIEYRERNGAFRTIEEITNVDGVSDSILKKNYDTITV